MEQSISKLEAIIKSLINKEDSATRQLENYVNSNINKSTQEESLKKIIIDYKNILFEPTKPYRQIIVKGDILPIMEMLEIIKKMNPSPENLFLLIHPIISIFKELDWRIIVDYSNHIYNLLKSQTKLILKFFNEIFEGLSYLKVHQEQEVRACGGNLDTLLKDTLTNAYKDMEKNEIEFNVQEFLRGLFEKLRTNHPGVKKYVVSWIITIGNIPQLKLIIQVLPEILPWLFTMLGDKTKDVNESSEKFLKMIQNNIDKNYENYNNKCPDLLEKVISLIITNCSSSCEEARQFAYEWLNLMLERYNSILLAHLSNSIKVNDIPNSSNNVVKNLNYSLPMNFKQRSKISDPIPINNITYTPNSSIPKPPIFVGPVMNIQNEMEFNYMRVLHGKYSSNGKNILNLVKQISHKVLPKVLEMILTQKNEKKLSETNGSLKSIIELIPGDTPGIDITLLGEVIKTTIDEKKESSFELVLTWGELLFKQFHDKMFRDVPKFIDSFTKRFPENNEKILFTMVDFLCKVAEYKESYIEPVVNKITEQFLENRNLFNTYGMKIIKNISEKLNVILVYEYFADSLSKIKDISFISEMVVKLNFFLLSETTTKEVRKYLMKYKEEKKFFEKIFKIWSYNPIAALFLCIVAEYFELCFNLILKFGDVKLESDYHIQLSKIVQLIESSLFNNIRIRLLEPMKNISLVKTLYGILMLLPEGDAYNALENRMKSFGLMLELENEGAPNEDDKDDKNVENYLGIFTSVQKIIKENTK